MAYQGHEGVKRWWANLNATFDEFEATIDEVRDEGDVVMALGHLRAQFRSGITLDTEVGWVVRFRDGLAVRGRAYQSHAEALEAAGFSGLGVLSAALGEELDDLRGAALRLVRVDEVAGALDHAPASRPGARA